MTGTWERINELSGLKPGWLNGEGQPPSSTVLTAAGRLADAIPRAGDRPRIYPTVEGGAQLEWSDGNLLHTITISPDLRLDLMTVDRDEVTPCPAPPTAPSTTPTRSKKRSGWRSWRS